MKPVSEVRLSTMRARSSFPNNQQRRNPPEVNLSCIDRLHICISEGVIRQKFNTAKDCMNLMKLQCGQVHLIF